MTMTIRGEPRNRGIGDDAGHTPSIPFALLSLCHPHTNRIAIVSQSYVCNGDGHTTGIRQACYWDATGMRRGCPSPSPTPLPKYTEAQNRHGVMGDTQWRRSGITGGRRLEVAHQATGSFLSVNWESLVSSMSLQSLPFILLATKSKRFTPFAPQPTVSNLCLHESG